MSDYVEKHISIADIHSVEGQDKSIAIYNTAPLQLENASIPNPNSTLKDLYLHRKGTLLPRNEFLKNCSYFAPGQQKNRYQSRISPQNKYQNLSNLRNLH